MPSAPAKSSVTKRSVTKKRAGSAQSKLAGKNAMGPARKPITKKSKKTAVKRSTKKAVESKGRYAPAVGKKWVAQHADEINTVMSKDYGLKPVYSYTTTHPNGTVANGPARLQKVPFCGVDEDGRLHYPTYGKTGRVGCKTATTKKLQKALTGKKAITKKDLMGLKLDSLKAKYRKHFPQNSTRDMSRKEMADALYTKINAEKKQ